MLLTKTTTEVPVYGACPSSEFYSLIDNTDNRYVIESHIAKTTDGYQLVMYRIHLTDSELQKLPAAQQENIKRPVHMQHG